MINPDFAKYPDGLVPVVVQDSSTQQVLMLAYMNERAFELTQETKLATFYSRSRQEIWVKGATSGNYLHVVETYLDCDSDSLLILAKPDGPTCHTGSISCFQGSEPSPLGFLNNLEQTIANRKISPTEGSYTSQLFEKGLPRIAQKVGEEAVETVIEAMQTGNEEAFIGEAADLLFHYLVLLQAKGFRLEDVVNKLAKRAK
jgi:phosphoribosyl-ATP pyrophosphohydrolase/phosphoribosyl-AMP cyclohydrolase